MIVSYIRNDSGQYYKSMILANVALARSVNYDRNLWLLGTLQTEA